MVLANYSYLSLTQIRVQLGYNYMLSTEDKIKSLSEAIKKGDDHEIHVLSKQLLKENPDDLQYQQCFIISSLKMSLGNELAASYFKHPPNNEALHQLYAYYLYDKGEFDKVIQYIGSVKLNASLKLLLAQAHFRALNYEKSAELMLGLIKQVGLTNQEKQEYFINLLATGLNRVLSAHLISQYEKIISKAERKELFYNYALALYDCQEYKGCLDYLKQFETSLDEGTDKEDLFAVRLFRDFVEINLNKSVEKGVIEAYEKTLQGISNKNTKAVAQNNLLYLRQNSQITQNTHEVLKLFDDFFEPQYKMTKKQRQLVQLNKLSVLLRKGRFPEAQKLMKQIQSKEQTFRDIQFIKNKYYLLKKNKDSDIGSYIKHVSSFNSELGYCLRVDNQKQKGSQADLIADLKQSKGKELSNPIIKNFIFSLLIKHSSLFEIYSDYLSEMAELTTDINILHILLNIYENKQDHQKQRFILLRLLKIHPKDSHVKIKMAKIYLDESKLNQAEEVLRGIEGPEELGDIAYLQFIEKNIHVSIKKEEVKDQIKIDTAQNTKKRIKKKKRVRLPKNIEKVLQSFRGDPQRWLPKWQRKGYKKKGKKGAGKTQGLATVGKEQTKNVFATGASTSSKEVTKQAQKKRK